MKLILATNNKHKIEEIRQILRGLPLEIYSMHDFPKVPRVREDKNTFRDNAIKKAKAYARFFSLPSLADDSGLEVNALGGAPGVRSARFAGPNSTKAKLCGKILDLLKAVPTRDRGARFVCYIALAWPDGRTKVVEGQARGFIGTEMRGDRGFGYDPIFVPQGYKSTFGQMKPAMKNRLSHRARALEKAKKAISSIL